MEHIVQGPFVVLTGPLGIFHDELANGQVSLVQLASVVVCLRSNINGAR